MFAGKARVVMGFQSRNRRKGELTISGLLAAMIAPAAFVFADDQTWTWKGGTGKWTTNNWTIVGPSTASESIYQIDNGNPANSSVTLSAPVTINQLQVSSGDLLTLTKGSHLAIDGRVTVDGKIVLTDGVGGQSVLWLSGIAQQVDGLGEIVFTKGDGAGVLEYGAAGTGSASIASGLLLHGNSGAITGDRKTDVLTNGGIIDSDVVGGKIEIGPRGIFQNAGVLRASAGSILIDSTALLNTGTIIAKAGGSISINSSFTNQGTIQLEDGGTVNLNGGTSDPGNIVRAGNTTVNFAGILDRAQGTQRFDAKSGSWNFLSGQISNATLEFVDGYQLTPGPPKDGGPTINDITIKGNWVLPDKSYVRAFGSIHLADSKISLEGSAQMSIGLSTIDGNGEIVFESGTSTSNILFPSGDPYVNTIEKGIKIHGGNANLMQGRILNRGIIDADVSNTLISIGTGIANEGIVRASAGKIRLSGIFDSNAGLIDIHSGTVDLGVDLVFEPGGRLAISLNEMGASLPFTGARLGLPFEDFLDLSGGEPGMTYQIGHINASVDGNFDHVTPGYKLDLHQDTGDFFVTVVPESSISGALPAVMGLICRRRKRQTDR